MRRKNEGSPPINKTAPQMSVPPRKESASGRSGNKRPAGVKSAKKAKQDGRDAASWFPRAVAKREARSGGTRNLVQSRPLAPLPVYSRRLQPLLEFGDLEGRALWQRIRRAIEVLQAPAAGIRH